MIATLVLKDAVARIVAEIDCTTGERCLVK